MEIKQARQGDILFTRIDKLPDEKLEEVKNNVIAEGEFTGHSHTLRKNSGNKLLTAAGVLYIRALQQAFVDHQEHATIDLPAGNWKITRQRIFLPEGYRRVAD